jgi:hypothetical protein
MTKAQAYKVLSMSTSASYGRAELLYREKCRRLRLEMMPGMPAEIRQKAQAELVTVDAAWQVIRATNPAKTPATKPARKPTAGPSTRPVTSHHRAQTQSQAQDPAASETPFSSPVMVIVAIAVLILIAMTLLTRS